MKTSFTLSNVFGSVYRSGNVCFSPQPAASTSSSTSSPTLLYSPTGNRLNVLDLTSQRSYVLPAQLRKPVSLVVPNPVNPSLILLVDDDGRAVLVNSRLRCVLAHINFKNRVRAAAFSPDARWIAVATGSQIKVWRTPNTLAREFSPFVLHRTYTGHHDDVLSIKWNKHGSFFLTTSKDMTARLYSLDPVFLPGRTDRAGDPLKFRPKTFSGHRAPVLAAFWSADETEIYTVAKDGACFVWKAKGAAGQPGWDEDADSDDDAGFVGPGSLANLSPEHRIASTRWGISARHYFNSTSVGVTCVGFHEATSLLVVGFANGVFGLYTLPDCSNLHTLSIGSSPLSSVAIDASGSQLALATSEHAQLMVWEWASESYVLKQQGHYYDMNCIAYSSDGQVAATGGDDGKVKLWNTESGFCVATFSEHDAPVSSLQFAAKGQVLFSASLDGTVRAWDLLRYRNFRTLTASSPVQFGCLAVEPSGEIVCAGAAGGGAGGMSTADTFDIYMWSVQTGKLLDVISGHEGPVSDLAFDPQGTGLLVSTSWDRTVRIHEIYRRTSATEPLRLNSDGLAVAFAPDGNLFAVATLDGQLAFFDPREAKQIAVMDCRRDIAKGRGTADKTGKQSNAGGNAFTTITFSADGGALLAGGNANFVCLYDVRERVLLKRWEVSQDLSLDGTQDYLDSRRLTEAGAVDLIDDVDNEDELSLQQRIDKSLPGAMRGDLSKRTTKAIARTKCVRFNPTGRSWAAASTAGLLVYSLDAPGVTSVAFDPMDLDMDLTPSNVRIASAEGMHLVALVGALRLGERYLIAETYERVPAKEIGLVVRQLPEAFLPTVLGLVAERLSPSGSGTASSSSRASRGTGGSPHVEFHLLWLSCLLTTHGTLLRARANQSETAPQLRKAMAVLNELRANVRATSDANRWGLLYLWSGMTREDNQGKRLGVTHA